MQLVNPINRVAQATTEKAAEKKEGSGEEVSPLEALERKAAAAKRGKQIETLKEQLRNIENQAASPVGCTTIEEMLKTLKSMKSEPHPELAARVLALCSRAIGNTVKDWNRLLFYIKDFPKADVAADSLRRRMDTYQHVADGKTYSSLLGIYASSGRVDTAMATLNEMKNKFAPDAFAYTSLVSGLSKAGDTTRALRLLEDMKVLNVAPTIYTINVILNGYTRDREVDKAFDLLRRAREEFRLIPTVTTLNTLLHCCEAAEAPEKAWELYRVLIEMESVPTSAYHFWAGLVCLLSRHSHFKRTLVVLDRMKQENLLLDSNTANFLVEKFVDKGDLVDILQLLDQLQEHRCPPTPIMYARLIEYCAKRKEDLDPQQAETVVETALATMRSFHFRITPLDYVNALKVFNANQNFDRALKLLDEMMAEGYPPDLFQFNNIIKSVTQKGDAAEICAKALDKLAEYGLTPNYVTYNHLILASARLGSLDVAEGIMQMMQEQGINGSEMAYRVLVEKNARQGNLDKALELLIEMKGKGFNPAISRHKLLAACTQREAWLMLDKVKQAVPLPGDEDRSTSTTTSHSGDRAEEERDVADEELADEAEDTKNTAAQSQQQQQ